MSEQHEHTSSNVVVTKGYRLFAEMRDACRQERFVGLGHRPPGTGKILSATYYTHWNTIKPFLPEPLITYAERSTMDGLCPYRPFTLSRQYTPGANKVRQMRQWVLDAEHILSADFLAEGSVITNNEMERRIRAIKTRYRRMSGRKNWNSY